MSEAGDISPSSETDLRKYGDEISEIKGKMDNLEIKPSKSQPRQCKRDLLTSAQKSLVFLEYQSLVDFVETDGEYIVSAGRDHDINVWDATEGRHIRRLTGHTGPVTGLYLHNSGQTPTEKVIVSSSEDGTIRQWSLNKGEELCKYDTENLITCMGVINNIIAVSGNHRGYMEVRHLSTGDLYSTILAHTDPIDALAVEGNYACSATFDAPSCLKVWEIQFEQTTCIYRIENIPNFEFGCLAIWNTTVILGSSDEQKLHIINFKTDKKGRIDLLRPTGKVQHVRVWNNWILSCSACKRDVVLDVHSFDNYEHFGTFCSNMEQIFAIAAVESDSNLKIILGGSSLAIMSFHFNISREDMRLPFKRNVKGEKFSIIPKKRGHYTMKSAEIDEYQEEKSTDSDESESSSEEETTYKTYKSTSIHELPDFDSNEPKINENENTEENNMTNISNRSQILTSMPFEIMAPTSSHISFNEKLSTENISENCAEPRVTVKKLEKLLDEEGKQTVKQKCAENYGSPKEIIDNIMKKYTDNASEHTYSITEKKIEEKARYEKDCETTDASEEIHEENIQPLKENTNDLKTGSYESLNIIYGDCNKKSEKVKIKFNFRKNKKSRSDKIKTEKSKHKKCEIM